MRTVWKLSFVCSLIVLWSGTLHADDTAPTNAILDKAIKAMGGEAKLAKLKSASLKGKVVIGAGGMEVMVTFDALWHGQEKLRFEGDASVMGMSSKGTFVLNGDKAWSTENNRNQEMPEKEMAMFKDVLHSIRMPQLLMDLKDKTYTLSPLGEVKVENRPAVGIRVVRKDRKDVSIFFDKESGLPVKSEVKVANHREVEETIEWMYGNYTDFNGIKHPAKISTKLEGQEMNMELSDLKTEEKPDESKFAKP